MKVKDTKKINSESVYYSRKHGKTGRVVSFDFDRKLNFLFNFLNDHDGENFTVSSEDHLEEFKKISEFNGVNIYEGTVFKLKHSRGYYKASKNKLINISGCEDVPSLVELNKDFSESENFMIVSDIGEYISNHAIIIGHIKEIEFKRNFDFDVKIFKHKSSDTFFYAGNMKDSKTIDLVKVVFVGSNLLGGEYIRKNYTYSEFLDLLSDEVIIESNEEELYEYAHSLILGDK